MVPIMEKKNETKKEAYGLLEKIGAMGITVAMAIFLLTFVGHKLDEHFNKKPLFTLVFFFWGLISAIVSFVIKARKM